MRRLFVVLVVTAMVAVHAASAAPGHRLPAIPIPIDTEINDVLEKIFALINEPISLSDPLEIRVDQDYVAHVYLKLDKCELTGVTSFAAHDSILYISGGSENVTISLRSPKVTLNSEQYFINGTMVDHVELFGNGHGMISVDEMDVKVEGSATVSTKPLSIVFHSATLDLEMLRWTVNLEDLMPGTDLGTVFNEFFSMYGPEIFDLIENSINKSGKLLDFLNSLFPPTSKL